MKVTLALSAVLVGTLIGAAPIAMAQTAPEQPAAGASTQRSTTAKSKMSHHHRMKAGTTTGMSSRSSTERSKPGGQSTSRKPAGS